MHLDRAGAGPSAEVVDAHVRVIRKPRHRHCSVHNPLRNHIGGEPLANRVIVPAGQIETRSAIQGSTGSTVIAIVGTIAMWPPPLVRAF